MKLHRLSLENFRLHRETEITFGDGITGLIGPNGSGKTTILEAIAWAMYGSPAARGTTGSIRFYQAPPRARVSVEMVFELGKHEYRVSRTLRNAELVKNGNTIANSLTTVTDQLTRLLGMSRQEFFNTYFTGQKELAVMAAMGAAERGRFLARLLGYENLRRAQDKVRGQRNTFRAELQGLEAGLVDEAAEEAERAALVERIQSATTEVTAVEARRDVARSELARSEPAWQRAQELREHYRTVDSECRIAAAALATARAEVERLSRDLLAAREASSRLQELESTLAPFVALREELDTLDQAARRDAEVRGWRARLSELETGVMALETKLAAVVDVDDDVAGVTQALERHQRELEETVQVVEHLRTEWVRDRQDADTNIKGLLDQYGDAEEQRTTVKELGPEGTCPTCQRPLGDHYEEVLEVLQRQLEDIQSNGTYFRQRADQLRGEPDELRDADAQRQMLETAVRESTEKLATLRARQRDRDEHVKERASICTRVEDLRRQLADVSSVYDDARHDAVRADVRALEPIAAEAERHRERANRVAELTSAVARATQEVTDKEACHQELSGRRDALAYREEDIEATRIRHEAAEQGLREAEVSVAEVRGRLSAAEEARAEFERRAEGNRKRRERWRALRTDIRMHGALDRAYQDLRGDLNARVRPELADVASQFVADLTAGRYTELDLDEQYHVTIIEDGVPKPVISGGEEDISNLVLRLAISQLVAERAGQPLSLLVLDEIFGSLDELRRHNVVELLRGLADRFPQVILITHIESVRDGLDRVFRVTYDQQSGAAQVVDETNLL